jgi:hypothetical protein
MYDLHSVSVRKVLRLHLYFSMMKLVIIVLVVFAVVLISDISDYAN